MLYNKSNIINLTNGKKEKTFDNCKDLDLIEMKNQESLFPHLKLSYINENFPSETNNINEGEHFDNDANQLELFSEP